MENIADCFGVETLKRVIHKVEQGQYIEVVFNVPENTEQVKVTMEVKSEGNAANIIDLGVKDPYRVRGWSGGARTEFFISKSKATPGYLQGDMHPGEWAVLLGSYRVASVGCEVTLKVEYTPLSYRWLKGDLHVHSVHSDGTYTLRENAAIAESVGLDFLGLTDHNTSSQNYAYPQDTSIHFIPGMELTTNKGHINLFGVEDPVKDFRITTMNELHRCLTEARENGAYISLNHPHCSNTGWEWEWEFDYDWVEVWNGPWRPDNQEAVDWWQTQLVKGKRLVAVGGSDTHRPNRFVKHGMPTTWVYGNELTTPGILGAIHKGHVVLSYSPNGPFIELSCGLSMVGDVCGEKDKEVTLNVRDVQYGDVVKIISNKGTEKEVMIDEGQDMFELSWNIDSRTFYRVEVWRYFPEVKKRLMAALSNPIYFE
ncbi:MAG: CehA/McbA family metallohydrolase [Bacillota bacterium]